MLYSGGIYGHSHVYGMSLIHITSGLRHFNGSENDDGDEEYTRKINNRKCQPYAICAERSKIVYMFRLDYTRMLAKTKSPDILVRYAYLHLSANFLIGHERTNICFTIIIRNCTG